MKKSTKILLGVLSFYPIVYFVVFFAAMFTVVFGAAGGGKEPPVMMLAIMPFHFLTMVVNFGLMIYYIVHAIKNLAIDQTMKIIWVILLLVIGVIAFPIYWYNYIRKDQPKLQPCDDPDFIFDSIHCPRCGEVNDFNNYKCTHCSLVLHPLPCEMPKPTNSYKSVGVILPYKNTSALTAYYLAVFSLIPVIGIVLGFAALVMGFKGWRYYQEHPEAKGIAHAWVGIILGGITGVGYLAGTVALVYYLKNAS